jgi:MFS family permease
MMLNQIAYTVGGIVTGFLITPTLSKYLGRRICIQLGLAIVIVSTFVQAFAPNMPAFIAGRLLMGMGQGLAVPTGPTYIAETAPARVRGTMMSFWQGKLAITPWCEAHSQSDTPSERQWYTGPHTVPRSPPILASGNGGSLS